MANRNALIIAAVLVIIIAVIAVFILGFPLGLYNVNSTSHYNACIPGSGYACISPILHNGTFTAVIGQSTGVSWTQANIFLVSGSQIPTAVPPLPCEQGISTGLASGQMVNITLSDYSNSNTCAGFPKTIGQTFTGTIWAGYRISTNSTEKIVQIGTIAVGAS